MAQKQMMFQSAAREKILRGATELAVAVRWMPIDPERTQAYFEGCAGCCLRVGVGAEALRTRNIPDDAHIP